MSLPPHFVQKDITAPLTPVPGASPAENHFLRYSAHHRGHEATNPDDRTYLPV